jgi:hypothetical protein
MKTDFETRGKNRAKESCNRGIKGGSCEMQMIEGKNRNGANFFFYDLEKNHSKIR